MINNSKKIAIYLNNTDRGAFADRFENDGEKTAILLRQIRPDWHYEIFDCVMGEFALDPTLYDGVILTGSVASVNDDADWIQTLLQHIKLILGKKTPLIGICFGHQAIAKTLGGEVGRGDIWQFGACSTLITKTRNWMGPEVKSLSLYCGNNEQVLKLPNTMDLLGESADCPIAMTAIGNHVMTTQYHPEMSDIFIAALIEEYADVLGQDVADRARTSIVEGAQGEIFAKWMVNFIEMDRT